MRETGPESEDADATTASERPDDWYGQFLYDVAGGPVRSFPLFCGWVVLLGVTAGLIRILTGQWSESTFAGAGPVVSGIYWFAACPLWVRWRCRDQREKRLQGSWERPW